jgi:phosphate transport system substrate-binding protein
LADSSPVVNLPFTLRGTFGKSGNIAFPSDRDPAQRQSKSPRPAGVIITPEGNTVKFKNAAVFGAIALTSVIALSACSAATPAETPTPTPTTPAFEIDSTLAGTITAGGSSAQANAEAAWTAAFIAQAKGVTVNYDKSQGSGGGVTNWLAGSYDFAGSDSPLNQDNQTKSQAICGAGGALNFPVYLSGVAIIYNLPGVKDLKLSSATLAKIFSLQITTWDDAAIAADNKGATLPSTPITVVTRSDGSGTTANFTNYLTQVQPTIFAGPAGSAWPVAGTSGQQGGSGVVNTVTAGEGTIGYADHSSIGTATAASIQSGAGKDFVTYSPEAATTGFEAAAVAAPLTDGDLSKKIDYTKISGADSYPIPLLSYAIACTTFADPAQAKLVKNYIGFIGSDIGQKVAAKNAGSAPVPASILADFAASLELIK